MSQGQRSRSKCQKAPNYFEHVLPSTTVRDLGFLIDSDVAMQSHVSRTVSGCFAVTTAPQHQTLSV